MGLTNSTTYNLIVDWLENYVKHMYQPGAICTSTLKSPIKIGNNILAGKQNHGMLALPY